MNHEEKLAEELDAIVILLQDAVDTIRELRRQSYIDRRDIKSQKTRIAKLEKELSVYKGYVNAQQDK